MSAVHHPLKGSEDSLPEYTREQKNWLDKKATEFGTEVGPCRWLDGVLVVSVQTPFDRLTFFVDGEGNEIE